MEYADQPDRVAQIAARAMEEMDKRAIPPQPNNFAVWYQYCAGQYPDLTKAIDILIENGQEFTDDRNAELFEKYLGFAIEAMAVKDAGEKLNTEIGGIIEGLSDAGGEAADYVVKLDKFSKALHQGDEKDLRQALGTVLNASSAMEKKTHVLEDKLKKSAAEIDRLKSDLEDIRKEAMTDALTGIANRKVFDQELRHAAAAAMEDGTPLCLIMLDIDHFKKFNDTYGHQTGDHVLRLLAGTLEKNVKGRDTPARYGGEEFGVVLPNTSLDDAITLAEQIRVAISSKQVVNKATGENLGKITVSCGVGQFEMGEPLNKLIARADEALYFAKRNGRNRVCSQSDVGDAALELSA